MAARKGMAARKHHPTSERAHGRPEAPNLVFWLRHCNIDRLWWRGQSVRGIDTYQPRTGTTSGVVDNSETMRSFATGRTPAAVANIANLNYSCA